MSFIEKITNYDAKKFLIFVFSIQFALIGSIMLDFLNLHIPILRQIIGFVYLTFVPGIVIHRAFKLQKLTHLESFICIIGSSILFLMFTGFFMNSILHFFVLKPISVIPLILIICTIVSVLSLLCYMRDKDTSNEISFSDTKDSLSLSLLFLCTIPFLSIFGSYLVNLYHTNALMVADIILISIVSLLIIFTDFLPKRLFPFTIFIIAISFLYNNSLASNYLDGWDIHYEYYYANLVLTNSLWISTIPANINAMLSIVMLAPIYSEICNLELTYVFKIIYPFLFSILPVAIYHIYQKQIENEKIAFLSVFFFLSMSAFYTDMLALARQQIAELFLVIFFLIILSDLELFKKRILSVLFILGLITSHYGLTYLTLICMPVGYLFMTYVLKSKSDTYNIKFILLFFAFALVWYVNVTGGSVFNTVIEIFTHIYKTISEGLFATKAVGLITNKSQSLSGQILKISYLISQFFIFIGFIKIFVKSKDFRISNEYFSFSFAILCILSSSLLTTFTGMNIYRLYHVASIFLSLFCVIGGITVFHLIVDILDKKWSDKFFEEPLKILSVFFVIFLFFNNGLGQQIIHDNPTSVSLNREWMQNSDGIASKYFLYNMHFPSQDVMSTEWLSKSRNLQTEIYADFSSTELLFSSYGMIPGETVLTRRDLTSENNIKSGSYIYLRYPNVHYGLMYGPKDGTQWYITDMLPLLDRKNLIYSNQDNLVYKF